MYAVRTRTTFVTSLACLVLLWASCTESIVPVGDGTPAEWQRVVHIPPRINPDLDLLFVIDDSSNMLDKQVELLDSFRRLIDTLEFHEYDGEQQLPNLHIGIVSADMGVGEGYTVAECDVAGDDAVLQRNSDPGCTAPLDRFIRDVADGEERITNYQNGLEETFACMSRLGSSGCRIVQPLEAMRSALDGSRPENDGFLRDQAALAVIIVSSEDDCSVADGRFFAPNLDNDSPVFRCFMQGVQCNDDVVAEGEYHGCQPRSEPDHMYDISEYSEFLADLKFDRSSVVVTGVIGGATDAQIIELDDRSLAVAPSRCEAGNESYPAVRLQQFAGEFDKGYVAPQCGPAAPDALAATAKQLRKTLGTTCMDGRILDIDPTTHGTQPKCDIWQRFPDGSIENISECPLPAHLREESRDAPCYYIDEGGCGDYFGTQLKLSVWWGKEPDGSRTPQPGNVHVYGDCLVDTSDPSTDLIQ